MTGADSSRFREVLDVSRETVLALERLSELLQKWTAKINLISATTVEELWTRHFLDSAQLWRLAPHRWHWVDLGSGGGLPGLVLAVLGRDTADFSITLVESDQRKSTFLRAAAREIRLDVRVLSQRIEHADPLQADVVTARALAPLTKLLGFGEQHLSPNGIALFPKGEKADAEVAEALEDWRFRCEKHQSMTDANSTILSIGEISRV